MPIYRRKLKNAAGLCLTLLSMLSTVHGIAADVASAPAAAELAPTSSLDTVPTIIRIERPNYPMHMRTWNVQGDGLISLVIGKDGKARNVTTLKSPHPAFENAMVRAVLGGEFKPGTKNGKPVDVAAGFPFTFRFERTGDARDRTPEEEASFIFPAAPNADVPSEMRYDVPPAIRYVAPVVYPREDLQDRKTGQAKVIVILDDKGAVHSVKVAEASRPEFGAATMAMMRAWNFAPAMKGGLPIATVFSFEQKFHRTERDTGVNKYTEALLKKLASSQPDIAELETLDTRPKALYKPSPVDHRVGAASVEDVLIEFFIDPEGNVQLPRILSANDMELGWAAATAVKRWIFEVPTIKNNPVFVRHELRFTFN